MKRLILVLFLAVYSCLRMYAAKDESLVGKELSQEIFSISSSRIAVLQGFSSDYYATDSMKNAQVLRYHKVADVLFAMINNKVDYFITTEAMANEIIRTNNSFRIVIHKLFRESHNAAFSKTDQGKELCQKFNRFVAKIHADGTYTEMSNRWFYGTSLAKMPDLNLPAHGEALVCGTVSDMFPFEFVQNGKLSGFDIELVNRFSIELGVPVKIKKYKFGGLIVALESKKIDMICASLDSSPEKSKHFLFSDTYVHNDVVAMAYRKNPTVVTADSNLWKEVEDSYYTNLISEGRYKLLLEGLGVTVLIAFFSLLFGTIMGGIVCYMSLSKRKLIHLLAEWFISLMHGIPILILLMILFYIIFANSSLGGVTVAIIAFSLNFSAYVAQMLHIGIKGVNEGQTKAALSMGFTRLQTFWYIVAPQAIKRILPVYKGEIVSLLKMTSVVGYIAILDLTKAADIIQSRTFDAFFPLIFTAIIYFLLAKFFSFMVDYVNKKI